MLDGGAHTKRQRKMSYNCRTGTVQCLITAVQVLHNIRTSKDVKTWTENDPCLGKSTSGFGPARRHVQMRQRLVVHWDVYFPLKDKRTKNKRQKDKNTRHKRYKISKIKKYRNMRGHTIEISKYSSTSQRAQLIQITLKYTRRLYG